MSTTPPGWQPDPQNPGGLRYWDGQQWTEHRQPATQAPTAPFQQPPVAPVQPGTSGCLKWGLIGLGVVVVLGVIGVGCLVVAGHKVADKIDQVTGPADPKDYDITSDSCKVTELFPPGASTVPGTSSLPEISTLEASGTITNTSGKTRAFEVDVRFLQSDGTVIGSGSSFGTKLQQDEKGLWQVTSTETVATATEVRCETKVKYWLFGN